MALTSSERARRFAARHPERRRVQNQAASWRRRARGICQACGERRELGNDGWYCRRRACREAVNARKAAAARKRRAKARIL